ncbi:MAG: hypothetical protein HC853_07840 [Anaerolineae bacterium]|nr:hypothetical protein [Anaerolineae bacterium]
MSHLVIGLHNFHHTRLVRPAWNIRTTFDRKDLEGMAESQRALVARGEPPCVQPLVVAPLPPERFDPKSKTQNLFIVAGNRRHAGNELLGTDAPPLNCIVREYDSVEAMMASVCVENGQRTDPTPLQWGRYFKQCLTFMSLVELRKMVNKSKETIHLYVGLLDLCPDVQALVEQGELSVNIAAQLFPLNRDPERQMQVALKLLRRGMNAQIAREAVNAALRFGEVGRKRRLKTAAESTPSECAVAEVPATAGATLDGAGLAHTSLNHFRVAAARQCSACPVNTGGQWVEPAWHLALAAAHRQCTQCNIRATEVCRACPLALFMQDVVAAAVGDAAPVEVGHG